MKSLFTAFPAYGHLLPVVPLAQAAAAAGDEVVFAVSKELLPAIDGLPGRDLGPSLSDLMTENQRGFQREDYRYRTDTHDEASDLLAATVALFTTTRADMAFDDLCALVAEERPDLIVAEMWDYVAPMVARRLGIPWVTLVHSPENPAEAALRGGLATALEQRSLTMPARAATIRLWPAWLESEPGTAAGGEGEEEIAIRPVPYDTTAPADIPAFTGERPVVLVTLGTVVEDLDLLNAGVRGVLDAGADALVTTGFTTPPEVVEGDPGRVRAVPFAPMAQLLDRVQAVVAAGGSGTTLASLSRGLPLAFVPRMANQPLVASVVARFGAGLVSGEDPAELASAVQRLLHAPELRARAGAASERLGRRPAPDAVWSELRGRI